MKKVFIFLFLFLGISVFAQNASQYSIVKKIHLPGNGGWDYLSIDSQGRLFVSHSNQVQVVDSKTGQLLGSIEHLNGVHGIAIAEKLNKGFISCGKDSSVVIFNLSSLEIIQRVKVRGAKTDAILYDDYTQRVFAFNGHSDNVSVLDALTNKVVKNIQLPGNPEFSVTDHKGRVYVNIEHASKLSRINSETLQLEKTWSIAPGSEPSGLAADFDQGKLFLVCANKLMIVFDLNSEKVVAELPIGQGTDGAAFDTQLKRAYSSNGEGSLTVVEAKGNQFRLMESFKTMHGGRTICLDPKTHHLFIPTAKYNAPKPGEKRGERVPDSFVILEIAPK